MSSFIVLDSSSSEEWDTYYDQMYEKDIYFSSAYFRLFEDEDNQSAELFVYKQEDQLIMYPYLLRSIGHLPVVIDLGLEGDWYDISTPYGYGGPISNLAPGTERTELYRQFDEVFKKYCIEKRIMTEFVRFHPMIGNASEYQCGLKTELIRNTVYMDLTVGSESELIQNYCSNHKRNIRKMKSSPLTIRREDLSSRIERFSELYYGTLEDLQADSFYYFPQNFISETSRLLESRIELFEAMDGEKTVAACIVIHEHPWMHYHLCGWDRAYLQWSPTKLLIHAAAMWGMENSFERFHLGGGYTGNDNLYQFKQGFATQLEPLDYYLGKRIIFPELYDDILSRYNNRQEGNYFPLYRHPNLLEYNIMDHALK
ncbi:GNAT family N-acetyltransferase [Paenibacillus anaericanus]|uniref:GNAT family N-acetyltransferase n=1 Tax=Paenibacillus anaericanus TaxID=170367 RepID=A0A3S1D8N1_9BACL|nr:GNAT family N-acetyltransferase [Paenibacillus anaericanus]RUT39420.1 GNAT family N-acetyltransferase [Paenibacillus anaericanus]